jgi:hypothetical protein
MLAVCHEDSVRVAYTRAGDLFLKMLRRMKQQWACEVSAGPDLAIDLSFLLTGPDITLGPPLTSLDEGMDTDPIDVSAGEASALGAGDRDEGVVGAEKWYADGSRAIGKSEALEGSSPGHAAGGSGVADEQHQKTERSPRVSSASGRRAPVGG